MTATFRSDQPSKPHAFDVKEPAAGAGGVNGDSGLDFNIPLVGKASRFKG